MAEQLRGSFEKFVDSPYYSESELCGGAVTVFFEVPLLASDTLLTTLHPFLENVNGVIRRVNELLKLPSLLRHPKNGFFLNDRNSNSNDS
jgi:hypothetical protein